MGFLQWLRGKFHKEAQMPSAVPEAPAQPVFQVKKKIIADRYGASTHCYQVIAPDGIALFRVKKEIISDGDVATSYCYQVTAPDGIAFTFTIIKGKTYGGIRCVLYAPKDSDECDFCIDSFRYLLEEKYQCSFIFAPVYPGFGPLDLDLDAEPDYYISYFKIHEQGYDLFCDGTTFVIVLSTKEAPQNMKETEKMLMYGIHRIHRDLKKRNTEE